MKIRQGKLYAVLTGDIVGSSRLKEKDRIRLHQVMKQGSSEGKRWPFSSKAGYTTSIIWKDSRDFKTVGIGRASSIHFVIDLSSK